MQAACIASGSRQDMQPDLEGLEAEKPDQQAGQQQSAKDRGAATPARDQGAAHKQPGQQTERWTQKQGDIAAADCESQSADTKEGRHGDADIKDQGHGDDGNRNATLRLPERPARAKQVQAVGEQQTVLCKRHDPFGLMVRLARQLIVRRKRPGETKLGNCRKRA